MALTATLWWLPAGRVEAQDGRQVRVVTVPFDRALGDAALGRQAGRRVVLTLRPIVAIVDYPAVAGAVRDLARHDSPLIGMTL